MNEEANKSIAQFMHLFFQYLCLYKGWAKMPPTHNNISLIGHPTSGRRDFGIQIRLYVVCKEKESEQKTITTNIDIRFSEK